MAEDSMLGGSIGPLIILFVIMGMIILYAVLVDPAERERLIGPVKYERDAINTVPGEITPIPSNTYKLQHKLADVEANFAPQSISQALSSQITIERTVIRNQDVKYTIDVNKTDLVAANLEFKVAAREGDKELLITLNNDLIFSGVLPKGAAKVPLPISQLTDGSNNVRIEAASPGILGSTAYSLQNVAFIEQRYQPEQAEAEQVFSLTSQELQGLTSAKFMALARQIAQPATLSLALNNKSIFGESLYADKAIELELPISLLNSSNKLTWTADKGGAYQIAFGQVNTVYAKTPFKIKSYNFVITDIEAQAKTEGKISCNLEITSSEPVTQALTVQINAYSLDLKMTDGNLTYDVCPYVLPGENQLSVQSSASVYLSKLEILMAGKAYGV